MIAYDINLAVIKQSCIILVSRDNASKIFNE